MSTACPNNWESHIPTPSLGVRPYSRSAKGRYKIDGIKCTLGVTLAKIIFGLRVLRQIRQWLLSVDGCDKSKNNRQCLVVMGGLSFLLKPKSPHHYPRSQRGQISGMVNDQWQWVRLLAWPPSRTPVLLPFPKRVDVATTHSPDAPTSFCPLGSDPARPPYPNDADEPNRKLEWYSDAVDCYLVDRFEGRRTPATHETNASRWYTKHAKQFTQRTASTSFCIVPVGHHPSLHISTSIESMHSKKLFTGHLFRSPGCCRCYGEHKKPNAAHWMCCAPSRCDGMKWPHPTPCSWERRPWDWASDWWRSHSAPLQKHRQQPSPCCPHSRAEADVTPTQTHSWPPRPTETHLPSRHCHLHRP